MRGVRCWLLPLTLRRPVAGKTPEREKWIREGTNKSSRKMPCRVVLFSSPFAPRRVHPAPVQPPSPLLRSPLLRAPSAPNLSREAAPAAPHRSAPPSHEPSPFPPGGRRSSLTAVCMEDVRPYVPSACGLRRAESFHIFNRLLLNPLCCNSSINRYHSSSHRHAFCFPIAPAAASSF